MNRKKIIKIIGIILLVPAGIVLALFLFGTVAQAAGLVDDTINVQNLYSQYSIKNYQLDFYVDNSWGWLPWNWGSGIGKSVMYGLYMLTNILWMANCYISSGTGYIIQEAYKLDFIKDMSSAIGGNIQKLAGVSPSGFSTDGFYLRALLLIILIVGIYAGYTGLVKHETSRALHAVINFIVIFVASSSLIAYAPDYIDRVNGLSSDLSTAALDLGTKIVIPDSSTKGKDSVDLIRDSLFAIQVKQPWLLLEYGTTDINAIGADRVTSLLSISPGTEERENIVKTEIETNNNTNMTVSDVGIRLAMVLFLLLFNVFISAFVFLLVGIMLLSQLLFILFAMFLPISFLLSMIPEQEGKWRQAIIKLFNTIMTRLGVTLIVTVAFSISSMLYSLSSTYPFFMVAFLQIVCFAGIYMKLGELMGTFNLQISDHQSMGRRMMQRPLGFAKRNGKKIVKAAVAGVGLGATGGILNAAKDRGQRKTVATSQPKTENGHMRETAVNSIGQKAGAKVGGMLDAKNRVTDKVKHTGEQIKDAPTNARYAVHSAGKKAKQNVADFKRSVVSEKENREQERAEKNDQYSQNMEQKRSALNLTKTKKPAAPKRENVKTESETGKQKVNPNRPLPKPVNGDTASRYQTSSRKERPKTAKVKEPKKKEIFQKPDYNEDMTAFKKNVMNRETGKTDAPVMLHTARRTPEVIGHSKEAIKRKSVDKPQFKENIPDRNEKGRRK